MAGAILSDEDCVWDIGTNVAVFGFAATQRIRGTIVMIEADAWLCTLLRRSAQNGAYHGYDIRIICMAVADKIGVGEFLIAARGRASNALAQAGGIRDRVQAPMMTLDSLLASVPAPDFMKIDVECAELDVIKGARRVLETHRPTVFAEVGSAVFGDVRETMRSLDYQTFGPDGYPTDDPNLLNYFIVCKDNKSAQRKIQSLSANLRT